MSKIFMKQLLLWITLVFALGARAADLPATLYMTQTSFSSTGRVSATGTDGVYEFTLSYTTSTATRYYVFSSASTSTNAKKDGYYTYGASTIADGTNIEPVPGKVYPLYNVSSDAAALISNAKCSAFVPVYAGQAFKVKVDLNAMTMQFTEEQEPVTSLGIFNKSTTNALGTAEVGADGKAYFSLNFSANTIVYFGANAEKRADTSKHQIWGASSQMSPENVDVEVDNTYPLLRTTYVQTYTNQKCSFVVPAGRYDIVADIEAGTVEFSEYTGKYRAKPATLNMRSNTFATSYATATGESGVYKFTFNKNTSTTAAPFYAVFTDATSIATARTSSWVLGSTTEEANITPEYGKVYPLVDIDPDKANSSKVGTFMPLYPQSYEVVVNLNDLTVQFNPTLEYDDLSNINLLSDAFAIVGSSAPDADGVYHYGFRGAAGTKVFFSTASDKTGSAKTNARHFGPGGHDAAENVETEVGGSYEATPMSYYRVYNKLGFLELPGKCDIEFTPATGKVSIKPYSGAYCNFPETMYLRNSTFGTSYGTAEGPDGVYTFEYTTPGYGSTPRKLIFTDATSYAKVTPGSWVLGASDQGGVAQPVPGDVCPIYDLDAADPYSNNCGYFVPFQPYTYTITVNLNDYTVTWSGEPDPMPDVLNIADKSMNLVASATGNSDGVYTFDGYTYSSHPVIITAAANSTELRTSQWTYFSQPYNVEENVYITDGSSSDIWRGIYYRWNTLNHGFWTTPEGFNRLHAVVDTRANTVKWSVTPVTPRSIEVLYLIDKNQTPVARCVSDDSGVFDFEFTLGAATSVAFSDDKEGVMANGRIFYGSSVPAAGKRVSPVSGEAIALCLTSPEGIAADKVTYYLAKGSWRAHVDMNAMTVSFTDVSLGGVWYTPASLTLCDDDLNVLATADAGDEGVFTFTGVTVDKAVKVVFADPAEGGSLFGANATGEAGPTAESGKSYPLYIPDKVAVTIDGASCFSLAPSTYDITVDFTKRTAYFFDPTLPVYPTSVQMLEPAAEEGEPAVLATASGSAGKYRFNLRNTEGERQIYFCVAGEDEATYYTVASDSHIADAAVLAVEESTAPAPITVPEGIWTIELSLADNSLSFAETVRPRFIGTTMPEGATFPSYFGVGYNPVATFTFNNAINSIAGVWVVLGDYAGGEPAEGETTALGVRSASLDDNKLLINFAGQRYTLPEGAEPKVHIVLSTIVDKNGETLVCDAVEGLPAGSMVFEYPFEEFARISVDAQFNEDLENIDEVASIAMRVSHFEHISFSDIVFAYEVEDESDQSDQSDQSDESEMSDESEEPAEPAAPAAELVKVPATWHLGTTNADGYTNLTVDVPMKLRGLGKLTLMLDGLDIDDGYDDHSADIARTFVTETDPTVIVEATPASGSTNAEISEITLTWTHPVISSVGSLAAEATLVNAAENRTYTFTFAYPEDERTLVLKTDEPVTDAGTYDLLLPAGSLTFNDIPTDLNNDLALRFSVDGTMGIADLLITDDTDVEVVTLSGIVLRRGKGNDTLRGLTGIYIVNGVKCNL